MKLSNWREKWAGNVSTPDDLVRFVNEVGCCTTIPLPGYPDFPNEEEAIGVVAAGVSDPWFWKDDLHAEKRIYYTRVFGGRPGFLSFTMLPVLIATNGSVFDELLYEGLVSPEMQQIYTAIETNGPISTRDLKKILTPDAKHASSKILISLERRFIITKTGITGRTRHTYSYIWDLVERWIPEYLSAADRLGRKQAAAELRNHLTAYGVLPDSQFYAKVLGWADK